MSYEIIKSIKVKDGRVFIKSASNNVYPRTAYESECKSLTDILAKQGQTALDIEIFREYVNGNFQGGANKYTRGLEVLRHAPEYKDFDWRGDCKEYKENQEARKDEYHGLLLKSLQAKLPTACFIIKRKVNKYFSHRTGSRKYYWHGTEAKASRYSYEQDAQNIIDRIINLIDRADCEVVNKI